MVHNFNWISRGGSAVLNAPKKFDHCTRSLVVILRLFDLASNLKNVEGEAPKLENFYTFF